MSGFDWPLLLRTATRNFGLKPDEFWAMTPAEFAVFIGADDGQLPMGRDALEALVARFPDQK